MSKTYTHEQVMGALVKAEENREYDQVSASDMTQEVKYWLNAIHTLDQEEAEEPTEAIQNAEMIYLSWVNDFLTVARLAEYYDITEEHANLIIELGRTTDNFTKGGNW